jgi:hypothetical protein
MRHVSMCRYRSFASETQGKIVGHHAREICEMHLEATRAQEETDGRVKGQRVREVGI